MNCDLFDLGIALISLVEFPVGYSFEIEASCAEVYEQSDFQVVGFQVIDCLGQVYVFQFGNGLQFH